MTETIPWKRFGLEGALIISSILAALAVDSWWEHRTDREVEQQILESLKAEFENVRSELDDTLQGLATSYAASKELMTFANMDLTDADISTTQKKLGDLFGYHSFDPPSGALQSLLTSGQLGLIQNIDLRTRLASWSGPVLDYKDDELELSYILWRMLGPQLDALIPQPNVELAAPGVFQSRLQEAFADIRVVNNIGNASYWAEGAHEEGLLLRRELDHILEMIESELAS